MAQDIFTLRGDAAAIFQTAIEAVDPRAAVKNALQREGDLLRIGGRELDLNDYSRVVVVGGGKATAAMATAVEEILGERIAEGHVVVKYGHGAPLQHITLTEAAHPVPDEAGLKGTLAILKLLEGCSASDLVISLISGGGSALLPQPAGGLSLEEKQKVTRVLLGCGATIHELNTIRKHLSLTKGGQLARAASPATVINLMLSDVVGDDMDVIASGPFVPDRASFADALGILDRYGIAPEVPSAVLNRFQAGVRGEVSETPKPGDAVFERVINEIVGSNIIACEAAARRAADLGYEPLILSSMMEGDTTELAGMHVALAREVLASGYPLKPPACLISGGETTVVLKGQGLGGRNQEFALQCARQIAGMEAPLVMLSGGTDGTDGPTDAAGGLVDPQTAARGAAAGLDIRAFLADNDAYHYLEATGDLLKTGPTLTNVMDVRLVIVG